MFAKSAARLISTTIFLGLSGVSLPLSRGNQNTEDAMSCQIASTYFSPVGTIPKKFTCDGPDGSPPLAWKGAPAGAQSLALIVDDPDAPAGTWVHWVLYDLSADTKDLP